MSASEADLQSDAPELPYSTGVARLADVMRRLRGPGGCAWDRQQTVATLRTYLIEESHELLDAIDGLGPVAQLDAEALELAPPQPAASAEALSQWREELGDVLLQVAFQAQIADEGGWFDLEDVGQAIADKMIRRHPHVFRPDGPAAAAGDALPSPDAPDAAQVKDRWEQQKRQEGKGALAGVPRNLPGLLRAHRIGEKAARIGFDWPDADGVWSKVTEELTELKEAAGSGDRGRIQEELGDLLFALSNLGRHLGVDAELGLRGTLDRFTSRFGHVERAVEERHGPAHRASLDELEGLWQQAKELERLGTLP